MTDLSKPGVGRALAQRVLEDIDAYAAETFDDGPRWHLGASLIGHNCDNYLWHTFRWTFHKKFDGRMQRLFQRGHREEDVFVEYLEGIGCTVYTEDLVNNEIYVDTKTFKFYKNHEEARVGMNGHLDTLKRVTYDDKELIKLGKASGFKFPQFRYKSENSHFGGSKDAIIVFPERYGLGDIKVLGEFKTQGTGSGFNKLSNGQMKLAKPLHWSQVCSYSTDEIQPLDYVAYFCVNKNDDSMYVEISKLDKAHGEKMKARADRIIASDGPMTKVSNQKTYFECSYCDAREVCHNGAIPLKNCRSCKFAVAVEHGEWACRNLETPAVIPRDFVKVGCDNWYPVTVEK